MLFLTASTTIKLDKRAIYWRTLATLQPAWHQGKFSVAPDIDLILTWTAVMAIGRLADKEEIWHWRTQTVIIKCKWCKFWFDYTLFLTIKIGASQPHLAAQSTMDCAFLTWMERPDYLYPTTMHLFEYFQYQISNWSTLLNSELPSIIPLSVQMVEKWLQWVTIIEFSCSMWRVLDITSWLPPWQFREMPIFRLLGTTHPRNLLYQARMGLFMFGISEAATH